MSSAKTVNQIIQSRHIGHQVGLLRLSTGITKKVAVLLNETEDRLLEALRGIENQRLNAVLKNIRIVSTAANPEMNRLLTKELTDLASYETEFASSILKGAIPIKMEMAMPSVNALSTIVTATPFEGKLLKEWVEDISESQRKAVRGVIRSGMVEGQTISQMARRIRGTRVNQYRDGIMETTRRGSQAMVRTAVNHTATQSRDLLYKQNEDMIKEVQIIATLDSRTTPVCQDMDGTTWPVNSGPRPPFHIACRTTTCPVVKSWRELGIDIDEAPAGTRASMNGQVPAKTTYNEWLKGQPAKVQDDILGLSRGQMFRDGTHSVSNFVDRQTGRHYTLKELAEQEGIKVVKKATKTAEFVLAKTIKEAEALAKSKGISYTIGDGVSDSKALQFTNAHLEAVNALEVKGVVVDKIGRNIGIEKTSFSEGVAAVSRRTTKGDWGYNIYTDSEKALLQNFAETVKDMKKGDLPIILNRKFSDVAIHEMGHNIERQLPDGLFKEWSLYYEKRGAYTYMDDIAATPSPSFYAQESAGELMAESLVAYINGIESESVTEMLKILKKAGFIK